jgi:hypothetical protein
VSFGTLWVPSVAYPARILNDPVMHLHLFLYSNFFVKKTSGLVLKINNNDYKTKKKIIKQRKYQVFESGLVSSPLLGI